MAEPVALDFPIEKIARRLRDGLERAKRGGHEWIEGSLEAAAAMYDARVRFGTDHRAFGTWIKEERNNGLLPDNVDGHELNALWHLGADLSKARQALTTTKYKTYRNIWNDAKSIYGVRTIYEKQRGRSKGSPNKIKKAKPQSRSRSRAALMRQLKLEDDYKRVQGTSLDSPQELDALVHMKEHRPKEAEQLIVRAIAGEPVSATAVLAEKAQLPKLTKDDLIQTWVNHSHKMLSAWLRADKPARDQFIEYLMEQRDA
jgi:hypothetical protein